MKIALPDTSGVLSDYTLSGTPIPPSPLGANPARVVFSAAHVVSDPFTSNDPSGAATIDWEKTMEFRRYLADLGLGIAEAMDTAQRGMGLDWPGALDLISRTKSELPDALVFNGCGTDQLAAEDAKSLEDVKAAYLEQLEAIQKVGGRIILMASRALAIGDSEDNAWEGLLAEGTAYIEMALDPEVQRIVLLDGPAVLGDPSQWPSQNSCLQATIRTVERLIAEGTLKPVDVEAAARLLNGAALNAALWVAASEDPEEVLPKVIEAFRHLATGLLAKKG